MLGRIPLVQRELRQRFRVLDADVTGLTVGQFAVELEPLPRPARRCWHTSRRCAPTWSNMVPCFCPMTAATARRPDDPRFVRYRVNLLVDHRVPGAPSRSFMRPIRAIRTCSGGSNTSPTWAPLSTDFTLIRPALHRANGGYLVLDVEEVLMHLCLGRAQTRTQRRGNPHRAGGAAARADGNGVAGA